MEFSLVIVIVVAIVLIIVRSITNVVNQLPNCRASTRAAIDRTILELGCFLNFKQNVEILRNKIHAAREQEVAIRGQVGDMERQILEALQLCDEAGQIINNHWYRRWSSSCYRLSIRVAEKIIGNNSSLAFDHEAEGLERPDAIPGIVAVILIAYSLTNAVLQLPNSSTATRDAIDWIVLEMSYAFTLEKNYKILRNKIDELTKQIDEAQANNEEPINPSWAKIWLENKVDHLEECVKLCAEAEDMVNHWYKGWTGSRARLSKRLEACKFAPGSTIAIPEGVNTRNAISRIDEISFMFPAAISDLRHYLHFNDNIQTLALKIPKLQGLIESLVKDLTTYRFRNQEEVEKRLRSLEAATNEGMQLIQEAERMDRYWYRQRPGSRLRLSKRVAKVMANVNVLTAHHFVLEF